MLQIKVVNQGMSTETFHPEGPLELGRGVERGIPRVTIFHDSYVSRDHVRIEELSGDRVRVENISSNNNVSVGEDKNLAARTECVVSLPINLVLGDTRIQIVGADSERALQWERTFVPAAHSTAAAARMRRLSDLGKAPSPIELAKWFETLLSVQHAAAGSAEFYEATARAVVELIGLDRGSVLAREGDEWRTRGEHLAIGRKPLPFSRTLLHRLLDQKQTLFQSLDGLQEQSLQAIEAVVVAPILDPQANIVGAVYGSRDLRSRSVLGGIEPLEAQLVQVLAAAVGTGLARMQHEREAATVRTRFEQFCSVELAAELQRNAGLLKGTQRDVTILFTDLRGSTSLAERLSVEQLYRLMGDLTDRLTECVLLHGGIIVDFYGDGLCAMWNAPVDQPDHADRACRAAQAMHATLPDLNARWIEQTNAPLVVGVGIHTGSALCGNVGGRQRLKYGPRGHAVNVAARVEGATKHLGVPILLTREVVENTHSIQAIRPLGRLRLLGTAEPVDVFQLPLTADANWDLRCSGYREALDAFEIGGIEEGTARVKAALCELEGDGPLEFLCNQFTSGAAIIDATGRTILNLPSK